jgi:DNA invertase Pin-like site-specific DNA recombinase
MLIGYARVSTNTQDLTAQQDAPAAAGVEPDAIYVDHGFTGTQRERLGLGKALAACRNGDTVVVTKLDRLARSLPDARDIADELTQRGGPQSRWQRLRPARSGGKAALQRPSHGGRVRSRSHPRQNPRRNGRSQIQRPAPRKQPKLYRAQEAHLVSLHQGGVHTTTEIAELFGVARSTVYRAIQRATPPPPK